MKIKFFFLIIVTLLVLCFRSQLIAQTITWGGLIDFELNRGGSDSSPFLNEAPTGEWNLYTPTIRLFFQSELGSHFFLEGTLQADYYGSTELHSPFISLLGLTYTPWLEKDLQVTLGRIVTPFGSYSERFLSSENPFINLPLSHAWNLPVDKKRGLLAYEFRNQAYSGQNLIYQRMYTQGIQLTGSFGEGQWFQYNLAATLAPPSSHFESSMYSTPSFQGRTVLKPWIGLSIGTSLGYGRYLKPNGFVDPWGESPTIINANFEDLTQMIYGFDVQFDYHYTKLTFEMIDNRWETALFSLRETRDYDQIPYEMNNQFFALEWIQQSPTFVRFWIAARLEWLQNDLTNQRNTSWGVGIEDISERTVFRSEWVIGYKVSRTIDLKVSYLAANNSGQELSDSMFKTQCVVSF